MLIQWCRQGKHLVARFAWWVMVGWSATSLCLSFLAALEAAGGTHDVASPSPLIPSAPNQAEIRAIVRSVEQSPQFADKWHLELEILDVTPIHGGQFARVGQRVRAFAFGATAPVRTGDEILALAEYVGDARSGQFRLEQIQIVT